MKKRTMRSSAPPEWLLWLCTAALVPMLTQIRLPLLSGRLALGDLAFLAAFTVYALLTLLRRQPFFLADGILLLLGCACAVSLFSAPGRGGVIELAQLFQQFFGGFLLLKFLVSNAPRRTAGAVAAALFLNSAVALFQVFRYGFASVLPPQDVLEASWGFGGAFTGLFRSRMSLAFFQGTALLWLFPCCFPKRFSWWKCIGATLLAAAVLLSIGHGQILLLAAFLLPILAAAVSRRAFVCSLIAVAFAAAVLQLPPCANHRSSILDSLSPVKADYHGELKTNHIDFIAALRMARQRPLAGLGPGRYQEFIGQCYRELPNPSWNDIESDTQASWGILAGTYGILFALLFLLLLCRQLGRNIGPQSPSAHGANAVLLFTILAMCLTDPWTRGTCWMPLLAFAAADGKTARPWKPLWLACAAIAYFLLMAAVALRPKASPVLHFAQPSTAATVNTSATASANEIFLLLDAENATRFTPPVEKGTDSTAAKNSVLEIPDGKGTPKDGQPPSMETGGAAFDFELPEDATVRIWLRVWWSGSCGNTLNIRLDQDEESRTIGNDALYSTWHWLETGSTYDLKAGKHSIELLNREDGIQFDQMLITNQLQYVPQGIEE